MRGSKRKILSYVSQGGGSVVNPRNPYICVTPLHPPSAFAGGPGGGPCSSAAPLAARATDGETCETFHTLSYAR